MEWTKESGICLCGKIARFFSEGDAACRSEVLSFARDSVSEDGSLRLSFAASANELAACGKALFFALDETGDERYRQALASIFDLLKAEPAPDSPWTLYCAAPFMAEYDTRFGKKETYKLIADQFKAVHQALFDPELGLYRTDRGASSADNEGFMLMALADTAEKLDMQIYEHYRTLADLFLEAVRGLLRCRADGGGGPAFPWPGEDMINQWDLDDRRMIVYAVLKGVRLGLLDAEKYGEAACMELGNLEKPGQTDKDWFSAALLQLAHAEEKAVKQQ